MYFQTPPSEMFKPIPATYVCVWWWQCRNGHNLDIKWPGCNLQSSGNIRHNFWWPEPATVLAMQWETKRCVGVTYTLSFWPSHTCRVSLGHLPLHRLAITRNKYTRTIVNKDNCPTLIIGTHDIYKLVAKSRNNSLYPWDADKNILVLDIPISAVLNWTIMNMRMSLISIFLDK